MGIPIDQIGEYAGPKVMQRGLDYYREGAVYEVEELDTGVFEMVVEGRELYKVGMTIWDGVVSGWRCTCPYDLGPMCKHVVAGIFHVKEMMEEEASPLGGNGVQGSGAIGRRTVREDVLELLEKIPEEELEDFVMERAMEDRGFRFALMTAFSHLDEHESKEKYRGMVRAILERMADGDGYFSGEIDEEISGEFDVLIRAARDQAARGYYRGAIWVALAIVEEVDRALNGYNASAWEIEDLYAGDIEVEADTAAMLLYDLSRMGLPEEERLMLFDASMRVLEEDSLKYMMLELPFLQIAGELAKTDQEVRRLREQLERSKEQLSDLVEDQLLLFELALVEKHDGAEAVDAYLDGHLEFSVIREKAIERAFKLGVYDRVVELAREGLVRDREETPWCRKWAHYLLLAALDLGETDEAIKYARTLVVDYGYVEESYVKTLRTLIGEEEWVAFRKNMVEEIEERDGWRWISSCTKLYVIDGAFDYLMAFLSRAYYNGQIELYEIVEFEGDLAGEYLEQLLEIYEHGVCRMAESASTREAYTRLCGYLSRMLRLGARERVEAIVEGLKEAYPRRRALKQEMEWVLTGEFEEPEDLLFDEEDFDEEF